MKLYIPEKKRTTATPGITTLLLARGFDATLSFYCTLCVFSVD